MVTATKPERRKPTFATLDDAVRDAEALLAKGYDKAGNWDWSHNIEVGGLLKFLRFTVLSIVLLALGAMVSWTTNVADVAPAVATLGRPLKWLRFPVEGFPKMPLLLRPVGWLVRTLIGKAMRAKVLANGFAAGGQTMPQTVFPPGGDAAAAVAKLKAAVEQLKAHAGPIHPSPLFGAMTKDEAVQLQLKHCEHLA